MYVTNYMFAIGLIVPSDIPKNYQHQLGDFSSILFVVYFAQDTCKLQTSLLALVESLALQSHLNLILTKNKRKTMADQNANISPGDVISIFYIQFVFIPLTCHCGFTPKKLLKLHVQYI